MAGNVVFCYKCGAANAAEAVYCFNCGAVLFNPDRDGQPTVPSERRSDSHLPPPLAGNDSTFAAEKKRPPVWPWLMLLVIALGLGVFFAGWRLGWFNFPSNVVPTLTALPSVQVPTETLAILPPETQQIETTPTPTNTPEETPTMGIGTSMVAEADGMEMMFVPQGTFPMGSPSGAGREDERPQHNVFLDAYWIDKTEVTNAMYQKCVEAGGCTEPHLFNSMTRDSYYGNPDYDDFPVINVDWYQAKDYCSWAGRALPTEAQWEKAAKGVASQTYPWEGDVIVPGNVMANYNNNIGDTTKVGSYPKGASPYGALDMAGNVWEWVADMYGADYYSSSVQSNPTGPISGTNRVMRGGSWNDYGYYFRTTNRGYYYPTNYISTLGFRCAVAAFRPT